MLNDSIVALSSGNLPSGVAIIRVSGNRVKFIAQKLIKKLPKARKLSLCDISFNDELIDRALIAYFPAPNSFTGEDLLEFHLHGSRAIVQKLLNIISSFDGVRLAKAGEFTQKAFENGKIDLIEAQGLADLLQAETESQRVLALSRSYGTISKQINKWRKNLLYLRSQIEALLDFSDEEDVLGELPANFAQNIDDLILQFNLALADFENGRIIREGFRIAIGGPVNAGKSSLINNLVKSDLAIVSPEEGTTRDIREVEMNIDDRLVIFIDMAGFRDSSSIAEKEGIRRAKEEIKRADLLLWLNPLEGEKIAPPENLSIPIINIVSKIDLARKNIAHRADLAISNISGAGIDELLQMIKNYLRENIDIGENIVISHLRDKQALQLAVNECELARDNIDNLEIAANHLLNASNSLARLIGKLDPEEILGEIFSKFCIGK